MKTITSLADKIPESRNLGTKETRFEKNCILNFKSQDEITSEIPVTFLKKYSNTTFVLDPFSASELIRPETPGLVRDYACTEELKSKTIVCLSIKNDTINIKNLV